MIDDSGKCLQTQITAGYHKLANIKLITNPDLKPFKIGGLCVKGRSVPENTEQILTFLFRMNIYVSIS